MKIKINGKEKSYEMSDFSVSELLSLEDVKTHVMVTVQINGKLLGRDLYENTRINEGDQVDFLYFMGGGATTFEGEGPRTVAEEGASGF